MAQTNDDKQKAAEQTDLFGKLEETNVAVPKDKAEAMKENILKDRGGRYLGVGVHEVEVTSVELSEAKTGTLGLKFNVENEDGQGNDTFWLSEAALPYTIENVSRIVVHNAPENKKAEAKNFFANIMSAKELVVAVQEFLEQAAKKKTPFVAFLQIKESPDRTYTDKNGEEKPSLERQLLSYKPTQTTTEKVSQQMGGGEEITVPAGTDINKLPF